jgi:hypothetical protein
MAMDLSAKSVRFRDLPLRAVRRSHVEQRVKEMHDLRHYFSSGQYRRRLRRGDCELHKRAHLHIKAEIDHVTR